MANNVDNIAKQLIQGSLGPSVRFGDFVLEVDNLKLATLLRNYREEHTVKASDIAKAMKVSKCWVHCLETGKGGWDLSRVREYLSLVNELFDEQIE